MVRGAGVGWLLDGDMFAVNGSQAVWQIPPPLKSFSHTQPFLRCLGALDEILFLALYDGLAGLGYDADDGVPGHPDAKRQAWVAVPRSQEA